MNRRSLTSTRVSPEKIAGGACVVDGFADLGKWLTG